MPTTKKNKSEKASFRRCSKGLYLKEGEDTEYITVATTHPDRASGNHEGVEYDGDILSKAVMHQIVDLTNDETSVGGELGAYRQISLFHDWVKQEDTSIQPAGIVVGKAEMVSYDDGHYGVVVPYEVNKYLDVEFEGQKYDSERVSYEINKEIIAGASIEYDTNDDDCRIVNMDGNNYRYVESLSEYAGFGFARGRLIANPKAVALKEIENIVQNKEGYKMPEEEKPEVKVEEEGAKEETPNPDPKENEETPKEEEKPEEPDKEEKVETKELSTKEINKIAIAVKELANKNVKVDNKVVKETKEGKQMKEEKKISLSLKEMKDSISAGKVDTLRFKEGVSSYFAEHPEIDVQLKGTGIPLNSSLKVKCNGSKLQVVGNLQIKSTLDTTTNAGAYTESIAEFADLFIPGLIETFNNQANLLGSMPKVDHLMGGGAYGWKIKTDQASDLSVDPDDPSVVFDPVAKLKLRTDIKEYRVGVSVTDYVLHHARATMGDLLMVEAQARMGDMMRDLNDDLFTEQVDTAGNKVLGLEAVADSAGNTSMYGKTRSTANRLAPAAAGDTYQAVGGALTTLLLRDAYENVEVAGARFEMMRFVMNPRQRTKLFELNKSLQLLGEAPAFGFDVKGQATWDAIPIIIDSSCPTDGIFVVDFESYYMVMSRAPQMIGLAKVGAAESAYVSTYVAVVYEQPRRVHMLDTLTA